MRRPCVQAGRLALAGVLFVSSWLLSPPLVAKAAPAPFPIRNVAAAIEHPAVMDVSAGGAYLLAAPNGLGATVVIAAATGATTTVPLAGAISRNGQYVYSTDGMVITRTGVSSGATEDFSVEFPGGGDWFVAEISTTDATGSLLAFWATSGNLGLVRGFLYDTRTDETIAMPTTNGNSAITYLSADGDRVTYHEYCCAGANSSQAVLWTRSSGATTTLSAPAGHDPFQGNWLFSRDLQWAAARGDDGISVVPTGGGDAALVPMTSGDMQQVAIDIEGRVVFLADAPTVASGDLPQLFVWHPGDVQPTRISVAPDGGPADLNDHRFWVADDGSTVTFESYSTNLVAGQDVTGDRRIYQADLPDLTRSTFETLAPSRYADSRDETTFDGQFVDTGRRPGGDEWEIEIAGRGGVPDAAVAAIVNVTVLNATDLGFATVHPCGDLPTASSINYAPGTVEPNEVVAKLSDAGTVCVYTLTDADVIVDVVGYVPPDSGYVPLAPARFADSRDESTLDGEFRDTGARSGGTTWTIEVAGRGAVPDTATAVAVNVTVTDGVAPGFATVFPCGGDVPGASSLNYGPGMTVPNELVAKLSPDGELCIFTLTDAQVIADVVGYLEPGADYTPLTPSRFADSRPETSVDGQFLDTGPRADGTEWEIGVTGRGDVPAGAAYVVANVTVTAGTAPGFATVHPCGDLPRASSLNYGVGVTRPNEVVAKLSPSGALCVYTLSTTDVILDIVGYG